MKKNIFKSMLLALPLIVGGLFSSCSEEELVFDIEQPQFELKADKVLLEVVVPTTTTEEDQIFISGAFNGSDSLAALDTKWQLSRSVMAPARTEHKWGIYLDSSVDLSKGYHFYNVSQGTERSVFNTDVAHFENPGLGNRAQLTVARWKSYFDVHEEDPEVEHDGYAVFILNESSQTELALYAWGDAEAFGGWPGMQPTGTQTIKGVKYTYFDTGEANKGLTLHLIPNNNNGGVQWEGDDLGVVMDHDVYIRIYDGGYEVLDAPEPVIKHDGFAVFVRNETTWEDPITLYMWGDENDLNGGWPGMSATGTQVINGVEYTYFDFGAANEGLNENLIFNNSGNGKQLADFNFTIERDLYLVLTDTGVKEEGAPEPQPSSTFKLYVEDNTGWETMYVYAWNGDGQPELFGGWPGAQLTGTETIDGKTYRVVEFNASDAEYHFIVNNNAGAQIDDVVVGPANKNYTITVQ